MTYQMASLVARKKDDSIMDGVMSVPLEMLFFVLLYKLVFFKWSFICSFMIQSTWWYYKFLMSPHHPLVQSLQCAASALPARRLQADTKNWGGERTLPFCCWVWVFSLFVFLHFVVEPERSLTWLMECPVPGLGKHHSGCRDSPASSRAARDLPTESYVCAFKKDS